jgi:glutamate synthase (NADPH/NADH) small chain
VTQIELLGEPPVRRPDDITPWPRWPLKVRRSYALKEGGEVDFAVSTSKLTGEGRVQQIHWIQNSGMPPFDAIPGTESSHPADLVLLAMGFLSPEPALLDQLRVAKDPRGNVKSGAYATSVEGVFAAGDARRGQSLIVWAIDEGRKCARVVDRYLSGLPLGDPNAELALGSSQRVAEPAAI